MPNDIGRHWLLLRGLSREAGHWGEFVPLLQTRFPSAQIHTLDLPGTGSRYTEDSPTRINAIMTAVRSEADRQGLLHAPLTLLGLSLGGMVAWEWLSKHPEEINAAVLLNSSMASLSPFYRRLRWQSYPNFFNLLLQPNRYRRELAIIRIIANRRDDDEQTARAWAQIQADHPVRFCNTVRQLYAAANYSPQNSKPDIPILLLNARGDRLVDPNCSEAIKNNWQLPLLTHPWAGHDLTLDDGAWVADALSQWLAKPGSAA